MQASESGVCFQKPKKRNIYNVNVVFVYFATKPSAEKEKAHMSFIMKMGNVGKNNTSNIGANSKMRKRVENLIVSMFIK